MIVMLSRWLDEGTEHVANGFGWLRELVVGEFSEDRPISVVIADMLLSFIPGAIIVISARDLAAVTLRLGKRYFADEERPYVEPPEWQEWVLLIACLIGVIGPFIAAAVGTAGTLVGTAIGGLVGDEAAAFLRALCLLLIRESAVVLNNIIEFLGRFTRGNIQRLLTQVRFHSYEQILLSNLNNFITPTLDALRKMHGYLNRAPFNQVPALLSKLKAMEAQFYAVQVNAAQEIPRALAQLDARLAEALEQSTGLPKQVAVAGVRAEKPVPMAMNGGRITSGTGHRPVYLERPPGGGDTPLPMQPPPVELGPNVHTFDPNTASRAQKGIYGEVISDRYMVSKGHENLLDASRGPRSLEMKPTGRGLDGVYRNGHPPPPFIITETKYRTGGAYSAGSLPTTKGSAGYPSAKQMTDEWIYRRLPDVLERDEAVNVRRAGYERWLMVVDENGAITQITKLDGNAKPIGNVEI